MRTHRNNGVNLNPCRPHPPNDAWQLQTWSNYKDGWRHSHSTRTSILLDSWSRYDSYQASRFAWAWGARCFAPCVHTKCISMTNMFVHKAILLYTWLYRSDQSQMLVEHIFYALQARTWTIKLKVLSAMKNIFHIKNYSNIINGNISWHLKLFRIIIIVVTNTAIWLVSWRSHISLIDLLRGLISIGLILGCKGQRKITSATVI